MRDTTSASTVAGEVNGHATVALMQTATTFPMFVLASGASDYGTLLGAIEIGSLGGIGLGLARLAGWRAMAAIIPSSEK